MILETVECRERLCDSRIPSGYETETSVWKPRASASLPALVLGLITAFSCGITQAYPPFVPLPADADSINPAPPAPGQTASPSNTLPQVTIEAQREALERRVKGFVRGITHNPRYYDEAIPRWRTPLCFAVAGLAGKDGLLMLARLTQIAASAGAQIARRKCEHNFYVVLTPEPDQLLKRIYPRSHGAFDQDAGMPAIRRFLSPSKPEAVRVWHNAGTVSRDDMPTSADATCGAISVGTYSAPVSCQYEASRLLRGDVLDLTLALVIVDTTLTKGLSYAQLADYAAMVGLTDIEQDTDVGNAPTILRLFAESAESRPNGLTAWDRAFLNALYHTDQSSLTQRSEIAVKIIHDVSP